jgi:hypothetical protein
MFLVKIWEKFIKYVSMLLLKKIKNTFQNFYTRTKVKIPGGKKSWEGGERIFLYLRLMGSPAHSTTSLKGPTHFSSLILD